MVEVANHIAQEHLAFAVDNAENEAQEIRHAGDIYIRRYTDEAIDDYCKGNNHVLTGHKQS